jgi:hypothetical protein
MSYYRRNSGLFFHCGEDLRHTPALVKQPRTASSEPPSSTDRLAPPEIVKLRKMTSATVVLPRSTSWLEQLPEEIRPNQLAGAFPRIVNNLCAAWREPDAFRLCAEELLRDRRGNRQGFPPVILNELYSLFR